MSNQHVLKIHPAPLADLLSGAKTAEVRRNDRGFQVGDTVRLMEVNPETGNWTGATDHVRTISHIQTGYGLPDGLCVLSYAQAEQQEAQCAQAGDERDLFNHWMHDLVHASEVDGRVRKIMRMDTMTAQEEECAWDAWEARAALATQPAVRGADNE